MKMMQKPSMDAVQLRTMLDDFLHFLTVLDFDQIWATPSKQTLIFQRQEEEEDGGTMDKKAIGLWKTGNKKCAVLQ